MSRVAEFCGVTKQFSADVEIASHQALVDMFLPARWRSPREKLASLPYVTRLLPLMREKLWRCSEKPGPGSLRLLVS